MPVRRCPRDGWELVLDVETARLAAQAGWPPVIVWCCKMGHTYRDPDDWLSVLQNNRGKKACPVCGLALDDRSSRRTCSPEHAKFVIRERARAFRRGERFVLEFQPWYRGTVYAGPPLASLDPLQGHLGRLWLDGWARWYGR